MSDKVQELRNYDRSIRQNEKSTRIFPYKLPLKSKRFKSFFDLSLINPEYQKDPGCKYTPIA